MSKAVLVMDMPKNCSGCPCCCTIMCEVLEKSLTPSEIFVCKPDWCPLKQMPEKKSTEYNPTRNPYITEGYNACIDELLGYNPYQE